MKRILNSFVSKPDNALDGLAPDDANVIGRIRAKRLTYLSDKRLRCLLESCRSLEAANTPGIFIEAGCALVGSTILISSAKSNERPFYVFDVFGMIPPPTNEDPEYVHDRYNTITQGESEGIGGDTYDGYEEQLHEAVQSHLVDFGIEPDKQNVHLTKGLLQDTMNVDQQVAFAHIDVDWYEPVQVCLERLVPKLAVGGILILDDYYRCRGCKKATDKYFRDQLADSFLVDGSFGSLKLTKL